jgi:hypothetical protein
MEETGLPGENPPPVASHRQTSLYNVVTSTRGSNEHAETIYLKIHQYEKWYQWDKGNTSKQIHGT